MISGSTTCAENADKSASPASRHYYYTGGVHNSKDCPAPAKCTYPRHYGEPTDPRYPAWWRRRYQHAARTLDEIGRLIGGWAKAHAAASSPRTFTTWFFPVGDDIRAIVEEWVACLRNQKLWGGDDRLFPATEVINGPGLKFEPRSPPLGQCWTNTSYLPGRLHAGRAHVMTTLRSYGEVPSSRQAEIIRNLQRSPEPDMDAAANHLGSAQRECGLPASHRAMPDTSGGIVRLLFSRNCNDLSQGPGARREAGFVLGGRASRPHFS
jgi:hypothetical protein